jgi:hypothetical protein
MSVEEIGCPIETEKSEIKIGENVMWILKIFVDHYVLLDAPILCGNIKNQEGVVLWDLPFGVMQMIALRCVSSEP